LLSQGLFEEVVNIAGKYKDRCKTDKVLPSSFWNKQRAAECKVDPARIEERRGADESEAEGQQEEERSKAEGKPSLAV
jgi:hypothetical protein